MESAKPKLRIGLIVVGVILAALAGILGQMIADTKIPKESERDGLYSLLFFLAFVVLLPGLVIALFNVGKRFRNANSRLKIYCWTLFVILWWQFLWIASLLPKDY